MADRTEEVNQRLIQEYIPITIVFSIVIIVGLVGNMFAVIYYGWKAQNAVVQILVLSLSFNDFVTNFALIHDIVDFFFTVTYRSAFACKLFFVLKHWLVGNSLMFMVCMAMDRYRRVCFPFSKQFTQQAAKCLIIGFSSFSLLMSVRYFGTGDIFHYNLTLNVNATKGRHCALSETELWQSVENIFHWIDICVHVLIIVSLIVFYSLVVRKVVLSKRKLKSHGKISILTSRKGSNASPTKSSSSGVVETQSSNTHDGSSGPHDENTPAANNKGSNAAPTKSSSSGVLETQLSIATYGSSGQHDGNTPAAHNKGTTSKPEVSTEDHSGVRDNINQKPKFKHHMSASAKAEMKITLMVAMITLASVLCFVPYYLVMLLVDGSHGLDSVGNAFLRRTYMLNSAINPFIMAFYNEPFRLFIKQNITCNCRKRKMNII